jgi:hypothetical protein
MPPLGTLLLGLALLAVVGWVVVLPLFDRRRPAIKPPTRREALENERREIVRAIRELDFDYRTKKIDEEDYRRVRDDYVQRGAHVLRDLNALGEPNVEDDIERRVAALRVDAGDPASTLACPSCSGAIGANDKFCPHCGQRLEVTATSVRH